MGSSIVNVSRKGWVDALRGLAILLVMYGHCVDNMVGYFVFTSPVKMPLFFAITGYVFKLNEGGGIYFPIIQEGNHPLALSRSVALCTYDTIQGSL